MTTVTNVEFKNKVRDFIDQPMTEPVYITKHGRRVAVVIDPVKFEPLISAEDNRPSYFVAEPPQDAIEALESSLQTPIRPELNHLMK